MKFAMLMILLLTSSMALAQTPPGNGGPGGQGERNQGDNSTGRDCAGVSADGQRGAAAQPQQPADATSTGTAGAASNP